MRAWAFLTVDGHGPYLAGEPSPGRIRVSTAVVSYDPDTGIVQAASGRRYRIVDPHSPAGGIRAYYGIYRVETDAEVKVIPPADVVAVIERSRNRPCRHTSPEEAEIRATKLLHLGAELRGLVAVCNQLHGIETDELAHRCGMLGGVFENLAAGRFGADMTVEAAEHAVAVTQRMIDGGPQP